VTRATDTKVVAGALRHVVARLPELFSPRARLLVAFSGGQDSTCLLDALVHLRRDHGFWLAAGHVDHSLRATSALDAARAVDLGRSIGVDVQVRRVDVAAFRTAPRHSTIQQAARLARYQALAALVAELRADALLLAHTADDQAETLLLNLLRGAGLAGVAAMRLDDTLATADLGPPLAETVTWPAAPPPALRIIRPLLKVERRTTLAYCAERELPIVEDPSNAGRAYTRNRVRHDLVPVLEQFNPAVRRVLARFAELAADDLDALDAQARVLHQSLSSPTDGGVRYALDPWRALPRATQRRLHRAALQQLLGSLQDVPLEPLEDALDLVNQLGGRPGRIYNLPRGVVLAVEAASFVLRTVPAPVAAGTRIRRGAQRPSV
jgi:tRNA(Ile)-lysidine synthetase-like protein